MPAHNWFSKSTNFLHKLSSRNESGKYRFTDSYTEEDGRERSTETFIVLFQRKLKRKNWHPEVVFWTTPLSRHCIKYIHLYRQSRWFLKFARGLTKTNSDGSSTRLWFQTKSIGVAQTLASTQLHARELSFRTFLLKQVANICRDKVREVKKQLSIGGSSYARFKFTLVALSAPWNAISRCVRLSLYDNANLQGDWKRKKVICSLPLRFHIMITVREGDLRQIGNLVKQPFVAQ